MPTLQLEFDEEQFKHLQEVLMYVPNGARIAASTAINKTAATGRSKISKRLAELMTARKSSVDKRITVQKSTRDSLVAYIRLKGNRGVALIAFGAKQTATGVTASEAGQRYDYPHAFIATGLSGNRLVFERIGDKRLMTAGRYKGKMRQPIQSLYGMTVVDMFQKTPGLVEETTKDLNELLQVNLASQVDWLLNRGKAQAA